jgi:hypothetical protein
MIAKLTWTFLILFFTNILSLKIFYVKHFLKHNPELLTANFSIKNGRSGMLISYYIELKTKLDFFWVSKHQMTRLLQISFHFFQSKSTFATTNPIAPGKYITLFNKTTDLCDIQNSKSNFLRKFIIDTFEKSSNVTVKCPFEKNIFRMKDWVIDADKLFPKSLSMSGNVKIHLEFLTKSNSSSKPIFVYSLKLLLQFQKQ